MMPRHHQRRPTHPLAHASRHKPRRWPLVLRFVKGAIHGAIFGPVLFHALFAVLIVYVDRNLDGNLGLPNSIIPSLSIVVGLMLVFRNQTSYDRFWQGRQNLTTITTSVRNLTRVFLSCSYKHGAETSTAERADTERTIRILIAIVYSVKNHLRAEWGSALIPGTAVTTTGNPSMRPEYVDLLPQGIKGLEDQGLSLALQLSILIQGYIKRGCDRGWFDAPGASQMTVQMNALVDAYGRMETIRLTPIPVAHLIHQKQVLALFGCVLPFAMTDDMGWWAVPIVSLVTFTLYGIEGIGSQLEDPFGYDRNDIKMDGIVEDTRQEVMTMLDEWRIGNTMFSSALA